MERYEMSLVLLNAAHIISDLESVEQAARKAVARDFVWEVLRSANEIPPQLEFAALKFLRNDFYDGAESPSKWQQIRQTKTDWYLHGWDRFARDADTIDGEANRAPEDVLPLKIVAPSVGLAGVSPMSLEPGPERDEYARRLAELTRAHARQAALDDKLRQFTEMRAVAEDYLVMAYSWPPYDSVTLLERLKSRLGENHPAVRRIAHKLAEKLPPEARQELEAIIAKLPPAGKPAEVRAARTASPAKLDLPSIIPEPNSPFAAPPEGKARKSKPAWMANRDMSATVASTQSPQPAFVATTATQSNLVNVNWYGLGAAAAALIVVVLWRAQARAHPRQSK